MNNPVVLGPHPAEIPRLVLRGRADTHPEHDVAVHALRQLLANEARLEVVVVVSISVRLKLLHEVAVRVLVEVRLLGAAAVEEELGVVGKERAVDVEREEVLAVAGEARVGVEEGGDVVVGGEGLFEA